MRSAACRARRCHCPRSRCMRSQSTACRARRCHCPHSRCTCCVLCHGCVLDRGALSELCRGSVLGCHAVSTLCHGCVLDRGALSVLRHGAHSPQPTTHSPHWHSPQPSAHYQHTARIPQPTAQSTLHTSQTTLHWHMHGCMLRCWAMAVCLHTVPWLCACILGHGSVLEYWAMAVCLHTAMHMQCGLWFVQCAVC
jgi:Zn-finger nucleic acid-binding protein